MTTPAMLPVARARSSSVSSEAGELGLIALQEPLSSSSVKATIVAVHGFDGHYTRTWTNLEADPPFFWIRDGLGKDLPQCRLLTYAYDASIMPTPENPRHPLFEHATNLHRALKTHLEKEENARPIIFISHNMGGILVKQVLVESAMSVHAIVNKHTAAILFFGTPHHGRLEIALLERHIFRMRSGYSLVEPLARESSTLFYETRLSPLGVKHGLVVNKASATLNIPHERVISLDDSHVNMVKPASSQSVTYCQVLHCLQSILDSPPNARRATTGRVASVLPPRGSSPIPPIPNRIDFTGYVHLFRQNLLYQTEERSISDLLMNSPTALLNSSNERSIEGDLEPLIWVHVPLNNTSWVNPCLQNIMVDQQAYGDLSITEQKYWLSHERKRENIPHSRYFEPSGFLSKQDKTTQFVIYLPYLHWDSSQCFLRRAAFSHATSKGKAIDIPPDLSDDAKATYKIIRDESGKTSALHPRRSLDQFFYSSLPETSSRDKDQVISKNTPEDARGGKKMIMVDQLWLWMLETREDAVVKSDGSVVPGRIKTSIFTSFPRKEREAGEEERDLEDIADLRQAVIDEANSRDEEWARNRSHYVGLVIEQAVNVMLRVRTESSLDFLGVFRAAIGAATETQTKFFREFQEKLHSTSSASSSPSSSSSTLSSPERIILDAQTKRDEVELALELSDIIDELNSLTRLFEAQKDALDTAIKILSSQELTVEERKRYTGLREKLGVVVEQDLEGYVRQVRRMVGDAGRARASLMNLLDLQQKEETLEEAHHSNQQAAAARKQADAVQAQSQILLLFTVVTIVFFSNHSTRERGDDI
ncbi:unnamed protein product [Periconia digitata]|uniref:GPI inositol-deacylase n=1 Tax=Periconia digitata TaxID=1303443 RepID=A0A9W4UUS9_9PLEO|nr:unnamed protein product [Periconia digitata]